MDYRFNYLIYKKKVTDGFLGLYTPIGGHNFVFLQEDLFNQSYKTLSNLKDKEFKELTKKRFLVPINFSEEKYLDFFVNNTLDIHLMYLLIDQNCNLDCNYCFEGSKNDFKKQMSLKTALNSVDYFFRVSNPKRKIIFYGGEPLLNKEVFLNVVDYIRNYNDLGSETEVSMVTNGTKIDLDLARFIQKKNVKVAVSIDGPREIHNLARPFINGVGSFDEAVKGFNLLKEAGADPSISCTIGKHNFSKLEKVASFFATDLKPKSVGFNLMIGDSGQGCSIEKASSALFNAYEILKHAGIYEDRVMRRLGPLAGNKFYLKDCAAYGNQIVVRYDGQVGPCHAFSSTGKFFSGDINDPSFSLDSLKDFKMWTNRSHFFNEECRKCPFVLLCGGGCAYNASLKTGNINGIDKNICTHTKMLVNWVIDKLWKKKKQNL